MKKILIQIVLQLASVSVFAQNADQNDPYYKFGEKYAIPILLGFILLLVLIIWLIVRAVKNKRNTPPPPPPPPPPPH